MSNTDLILKVKEAIVKDVGRAIARIDPNDMAHYGLESGDIVMIEGKRPTPVKLLPSYPDDRNKGIIQIDGITRENANVGIDEKVIRYPFDTKNGRKFQYTLSFVFNINIKDPGNFTLGNNSHIKTA